MGNRQWKMAVTTFVPIALQEITNVFRNKNNKNTSLFLLKHSKNGEARFRNLKLSSLRS